MRPLQWQFSLASALVSMFIAGCGPLTAPDKTGEPYPFRLGPVPELTGGRDRRFLVMVPAHYVDIPEASRDRPTDLDQVTFAFNLGTLKPVAKDQLATPGTIIGTVGWDQEEGVRSRLDGTVMKLYYERYSLKGAPRFGLDVTRTDSPHFNSVIYHSADRRVLIECIGYGTRDPDTCQLMHNPFPHVAVEAVFPPDLLPKWTLMIDGVLKSVTVQPLEDAKAYR